MTDTKKSVSQTTPYEAFVRVEKRPACKSCLAKGVISPHNPPDLINCPQCGTPFVGVVQTEEVSDVTVTVPKLPLRQRVATWLMTKIKTDL